MIKVEAARIEREKQEQEAKSLQEKEAEAQRLYDEALRLIERKDLVAAVKKLKASQVLDPSSVIIQAKLKKTEDAVREAQE